MPTINLKDDASLLISHSTIHSATRGCGTRASSLVHKDGSSSLSLEFLALRCPGLCDSPLPADIPCANCTMIPGCNITCPSGSFRDGFACQSCAAGFFSPTNDTTDSCLPCPAGTFAAAPMSTSCAPCPVGAASVSEGSSFCLNCSTDFITSSPGATACDELTTFGLILALVASALVAVPTGLLWVRHRAESQRQQKVWRERTARRMAPVVVSS